MSELSVGIGGTVAWTALTPFFAGAVGVDLFRGARMWSTIADPTNVIAWRSGADGDLSAFAAVFGDDWVEENHRRLAAQRADLVEPPVLGEAWARLVLAQSTQFWSPYWSPTGDDIDNACALTDAGFERRGLQAALRASGGIPGLIDTLGQHSAGERADLFRAVDLLREHIVSDDGTLEAIEAALETAGVTPGASELTELVTSAERHLSDEFARHTSAFGEAWSAGSSVTTADDGGILIRTRGEGERAPLTRATLLLDGEVDPLVVPPRVLDWSVPVTLRVRDEDAWTVTVSVRSDVSASASDLSAMWVHLLDDPTGHIVGTTRLNYDRSRRQLLGQLEPVPGLAAVRPYVFDESRESSCRTTPEARPRIALDRLLLEAHAIERLAARGPLERALELLRTDLLKRSAAQLSAAKDSILQSNQHDAPQVIRHYERWLANLLTTANDAAWWHRPLLGETPPLAEVAG